MDVIEVLVEAIRERGLQLKFGLRAQGHVPTVERMLSDGASWEEIGKAIGWDAKTARGWYDRFERKSKEDNVQEIKNDSTQIS